MQWRAAIICKNLIKGINPLPESKWTKTSNHKCVICTGVSLSGQQRTTGQQVLTCWIVWMNVFCFILTSIFLFSVFSVLLPPVVDGLMCSDCDLFPWLFYFGPVVSLVCQIVFVSSLTSILVFSLIAPACLLRLPDSGWTSCVLTWLCLFFNWRDQLDYNPLSRPFPFYMWPLPTVRDISEQAAKQKQLMCRWQIHGSNSEPLPDHFATKSPIFSRMSCTQKQWRSTNSAFVRHNRVRCYHHVSVTVLFCYKRSRDN